MKKLISLVLAVVMVLGLCACGTSGNEDKAPEGLQVGFGMQDITPETSVPLAGYGNTHKRMSTDVMDKIYITCIAMSEGNETVLMFSQDLITTNPKWLANLRQKCQAELGISPDRVLISSTHTHSSVDSKGQVGAYPDLWLNAAFTAAKQALDDRAATTIYTGSVETKDMTYVRHYRKGDGSYCGDGFGDKLTGAKIEDYATKANEEMLLVKFDRADEAKKDILLMNFQAHPCMTANAGKSKSISADFIGFTRQIIHEETDLEFIYFTGSAGNQNTFSYIDEEDDILKVDKYSEKLAQYALDNLDSLKVLEGSGIKTVQNNYEYAVNKDMTDPETLSLIQQIKSLQSSDPNKAKVMMEQNGLNTSHISYVVNRVNKPEKDTMELNVVYVAGMAFVVAPYEMFSDTALAIREQSPFETTVIATCASNEFGYFATKEAYAYKSYESIIGLFAEGCAEAAQEQFVQMLKSVQ